MAKKKQEKDPWEILPEGYVEKVESLSTDEIRKEVSDTVMILLDTQHRFKNDPDVLQAQETLAQYADPYKDDIKVLKKKLEFGSIVLESRGAGLK